MPRTLTRATLTTSISWTPAASKPDADLTYLLAVDDEDGARDCYQGWWDGYFWRDCATGGIVGGTVAYWGEPELPQ